MEERALAPTPTDAALPHLGIAVDSRVMAPRLAPLLDGHGKLDIAILKHTLGKRCVVAYRFENGARGIGKMLRKQRATRHAAVLVELQQSLVGMTRTPRLLGCFDDLGLVLQEWVPGDHFPEYADLAGRGTLVERLGAALAALHSSRVAIERRADLAAHLRRTCGAGPALWADLSNATRHSGVDLQTQMLAREAVLARTLRPCHGDFSPRQIFVHPSRVSFVDVDGLCLGDPSLDVASFRVGLQAHLADAGLALADRFLAAYGAAGGDPVAGLDVYEAFHWLRRAVMLWRKRPVGWESQLERCLERGHGSLSL